MTNSILKIKLLLAFVIPIFLFLPIGSCERKATKITLRSDENVALKKAKANSITPATPSLSSSDVSKTQKTPTTDYLVLAKSISLDDIGGLISLGVLLWPLLFFPLARRVAESRWKRRLMNFLEVFLIGFSFYCFYGVFQLYKPTLWGYLLTAFFALYSFVFFAELLILSLKKKAVKK